MSTTNMVRIQVYNLLVKLLRYLVHILVKLLRYLVHILHPYIHTCEWKNVIATLGLTVTEFWYLSRL